MPSSNKELNESQVLILAKCKMYVVKLCPKKVSLVFDSCQFYTFLGYRLSMTTTEIIFNLKLFALQSLKKRHLLVSRVIGKIKAKLLWNQNI